VPRLTCNSQAILFLTLHGTHTRFHSVNTTTLITHASMLLPSPCVQRGSIHPWLHQPSRLPDTRVSITFLPVTIIMFITATPRVSLTFELTFKFSYPLLVLYIINIYQIMTQNTHRHGLFNLSRNACSKIWQGLSKANCRVVSVIWSKQMVVYGGTAQ